MTMSISPFLESLKSFALQEDGLAALRKKAWERFEELGLPLSKDEAFQYMNLRELLNHPYQQASFENVDVDAIERAVGPYKNEPYIVLYNGHFAPRYSNFNELSSRIIVKPLVEAFNSYSVFLKDLFQKWIQNEKNPFALLSISFHTQGVFIYVPANHTKKHLVRIIEIESADVKKISAPLVMTSCGKNSQFHLSTISARQELSEQACFSSFYFYLDENAYLTHTHFTQALNQYRLESIRTALKKASSFKSCSFVSQIPKLRQDYQVQLLDKQGHAEVCSLAVLKEKQEAHMNILIEHKAENCFSRQLVKNLLDDKAAASFEGKIKVDSVAQQTNAYQLNQNCLLSDSASAYSKPNLEIFADDVKASHGSTTGQIDLDQLFYLRSRGLDKKMAKKILLNAFCQEVLDEIADEILKKEMYVSLSNYFEVS